MWAGVPAEMEVYNLFSGLVRQEGLSRLERAQQRQSLVPDLRIAIAPQAVADAEVARDLRIRGGAGAMRGGGGTVEVGVLHEVKIISCSKTRYKSNSLKRAVDARADLLPQEYVNKARGADRKHNQIPEGTIGPVERKLVELGEVRGIVSGNFGEVSEHTHALVAALATCRVRVAGVHIKGKKGTYEDRGGGKVTGYICPEETPRSFDSAVPGTFTLGQAGGIGAGSECGSWEEVAGS